MDDAKIKAFAVLTQMCQKAKENLNKTTRDFHLIEPPTAKKGKTNLLFNLGNLINSLPRTAGVKTFSFCCLTYASWILNKNNALNKFLNLFYFCFNKWQQWD